MARKRTIDPDFWTDDKVVALNDVRAALFYVGCISQSDDFGRIEWSARQLWARLFSAREDVKMPDVSRWMEDVARVELMVPYQANGRIYAFHPQWKKHQYVSRPTRSKNPEPPPDLFGRFTENIRKDSEQVPETPRTPCVPSDTDTDTVSGTVITDSLRSSAVAFGDWPEKSAELTALTALFIQAFANTKEPGKIKAANGIWASALSAMRGRRGVTIADAWAAFAEAKVQNGDKPLWGGLVKTAMSYLPARDAKPAGKSDYMTRNGLKPVGGS